MNSFTKTNNRHTLRLKSHNYSNDAVYFVTICTQKNSHYFGTVKDGKMIYNNAGIMISRWWNNIQIRYNSIIIHNYIVMPNHFHAIIQINAGAIQTGATQCGRPIVSHQNGGRPIVYTQSENTYENGLGNHVNMNESGNHETNESGKHIGLPLWNLGLAIGWFKTMTTNEYIRNVKQNAWPRFHKKLWHRNYYERIIWDKNAFDRISYYIRMNPSNW